MQDGDSPLAAPREDLGLRHRLIAWRVMALVNLTQRSGTTAYRRATGLSDAEWRIVHQVGVHASVLVMQLAALLSRDKGQISRAVGRLVERGVLMRANRRAPIALSSRGRAIYSKILAVARSRNIALTSGLSDTELRKLPLMLARMQAQGRRLIALSDDRGRTTVASRQAALAAQLTDREDLRRSQRDAMPRERLILPDFINLGNLLRSSAGSVFREATGLSEFEWLTVSQVGEYRALTLIELVSHMSRDKSQVGRAVKRLVALGHISAHKIGGGRHVRLVITPSGHRIYQRAARVALARNNRILSDLSRAERRLLFSILDRLASNAVVLLGRGRAQAA